MVPFSIFVLLTIFIFPLAFGEEASYTLEPIVVVPRKSSLLESQNLRKITVISQHQIQKLPAHSVPELIKGILGVDIRQRGSWGVQADVNIRGSNFEQILICVNGTRINDPQTGHHNMDLPLSLADIERIEVFAGDSSFLFGPGAFAGAINIVTKKPEDEGLEIELSGGRFGLSAQSISVNYPLRGFDNRLSFSRKESSGYRPDTDFEISSLSLNSRKEFDWGALEYLFGYTDKDFGADSFYSNLYPSEEEHTDTRFFDLKAHIKNEIFELQSDFYYRRHADKFILDRNRPSWYVNYHTSYSYGTSLEALRKFSFGSLIAGTQVGWEEITSTRLGEHRRDTQGLYGRYQSPLEENLAWNLGLRLDHYQKWGWQTSPSLSMGYKLTPRFRFKSSLGRSFRIPSFTDLYYQSSANIGNEDLTPEKAWCYEAGLEFKQGQGLFSELTYFRRLAEDLIGWFRASSNEAWQAQNISEVDTQGLQLEFSYKPKRNLAIISEIRTGYIYQYLEREGSSLNEKYTLDFLKHHVHLGLFFNFLEDLTQSLTLSYKQRIDQRPYFLLDSRITKKIESDNLDWEIFLDITNLFNTSYAEQGDVRMPGRWVVAGVRVKL